MKHWNMIVPMDCLSAHLTYVRELWLKRLSRPQTSLWSFKQQVRSEQGKDEAFGEGEVVWRSSPQDSFYFKCGAISKIKLWQQRPWQCLRVVVCIPQLCENGPRGTGVGTISEFSLEQRNDLKFDVDSTSCARWSLSSVLLDLCMHLCSSKDLKNVDFYQSFFSVQYILIPCSVIEVL